MKNQNQPKKRINRIKCPFCQERYLVPKYRDIIARPSQEKEWICLDCPTWVWPESWFNELTQFEHLIVREGKE